MWAFILVLNGVLNCRRRRRRLPGRPVTCTRAFPLLTAPSHALFILFNSESYHVLLLYDATRCILCLWHVNFQFFFPSEEQLYNKQIRGKKEGGVFSFFFVFFVGTCKPTLGAVCPVHLFLKLEQIPSWRIKPDHRPGRRDYHGKTLAVYLMFFPSGLSPWPCHSCKCFLKVIAIWPIF